MYKINNKSNFRLSDIKKALEQKKWKIQKYKKNIKKRSQIVEPPFGVLKQYKDLNTVKVTGKKK